MKLNPTSNINISVKDETANPPTNPLNIGIPYLNLPIFHVYQDATEKNYGLTIPFSFKPSPITNIDLALTYRSQGEDNLLYQGKYHKSNITTDYTNSLLEIESHYIYKESTTNLSRWLFNMSYDQDISEKTKLSTQYYRVSDINYFKEVLAGAGAGLETLSSHVKLDYKDTKNSLFTTLLSENQQIVNAGDPGYTREGEISISKNFTDSKIPLKIDIDMTKFAHDTVSKTTGTRSHGNISISKDLYSKFPVITPNANILLTNYSLKNNTNINRIIFGTGIDMDFTINKNIELFGNKINHRITPIISYNYRARKEQGNIPIFDTTDKYDDIITFLDLKSGERYTGLDRITNANDITLSLESSYKGINSDKEDNDLLNVKFAQSFFTDDEVVSATINTNYETRKSYSDIAGSINFSYNNYFINNEVQYKPEKSKIVKSETSIGYNHSSNDFVEFKYSDEGQKKTKKNIYGSYVLNDSIHLFGAYDKTTSTGITNSQMVGISYEAPFLGLRVAHFKTDTNGVGKYNYNTGVELVLPGIGSTSFSLKKRIIDSLPGYNNDFRFESDRNHIKTFYF